MKTIKANIEQPWPRVNVFSKIMLLKGMAKQIIPKFHVQTAQMACVEQLLWSCEGMESPNLSISDDK